MINATFPAVDCSDQPVIATWWAPDAQTGNHSRQYMLFS
jgi:hypothetical protein